MKLRGFDREGERRLSCPTRLLIASGAVAGFSLFISPSALADDTTSTDSSASSGNGQQTQTSTDQGTQGNSQTQVQSSSSSSSSPSSSSDANSNTLSSKVEQLATLVNSTGVTAPTEVSTAQTQVSEAVSATQTQTNAQTSLDSANTSLSTAQATEASAQSAVTSATDANNVAQAAVTSQETVVASAQATATSTQAAADAANVTTTSTVVENFSDSTTTDSGITITVGSSNVTTSNQSGVYIGGNWTTSGAGTVSGTALVLQSPSQPVTIDVPNTTTQVEFSVYAKNGDSTATTTLTSGTTSTFTIENDVDAQHPGYTHVETVTAPTSQTIDKITVPSDYDYYIIDTIKVTSTTTTSNPTLIAEAQAAAQTLKIGRAHV